MSRNVYEPSDGLLMISRRVRLIPRSRNTRAVPAIGPHRASRVAHRSGERGSIVHSTSSGSR